MGDFMSDAADDAAQREELERTIAVAAARQVPPDAQPVLDCIECSNMTQAEAKVKCEFFANCVSDWTRLTRMTKIKGKPDGLV
jgi:hypothetical protein